MNFAFTDVHIQEHNTRGAAALAEDYDHLALQLARRGVDIERLVERAAAFRVAVPSWGVGTGGTRFARFPGEGEPRNIFEKLEDCEVVFRATRVTPGISLHIPWDKPENAGELRSFAASSRTVLRLDELEHLSGSARTAALIQVRQPEPHAMRPCDGRRWSTTSNVSSIGAAAWRPGSHRMDR